MTSMAQQVWLSCLIEAPATSEGTELVEAINL